MDSNKEVAVKEIKKRCSIYIDGFNCYFGIFRYRPELKWFNFQSFFEVIRDKDEVVSVKYFTALVDPKLHSVATYERQRLYINALKTQSKIRVILGSYQGRTVSCRATCRNEYITPEEKKTDVNIAVNLMNDAVKGNTDNMVIVSGDSDLEPAVLWVRENKPDIKIVVYIPAIPENQGTRRNDNYNSFGITPKFLPMQDMYLHVFPDDVPHKSGNSFKRPISWVKSN